MAVANSTLTPLPVRWRFPHEAEDEDDGSLEQDSLGTGDQDSLQSPGYPLSDLTDDVGDAWEPQRMGESPPRLGNFELRQYQHSPRLRPLETRFDIAKRGLAASMHQAIIDHHGSPNNNNNKCRNKNFQLNNNDLNLNNNNNGSPFVHPAIFDQEKWEKHKQLIREYFAAQRRREEDEIRDVGDPEWGDPALPAAPDWEPYRRALLPQQVQLHEPAPQQVELAEAGVCWEALPPIREQPGEMVEGGVAGADDEEADGERASPSRDSNQGRPASRESSGSPASPRGGRPTLQLVGVTLDSSSDDASVDSGHGASAASAASAASLASTSPPRNQQYLRPSQHPQHPPPPPPPPHPPAPAALRSHRKELSMDSGIQGSSCDLASGDAGAATPASGASSAASPAASDAGADVDTPGHRLRELLDHGSPIPRSSPPCGSCTPTLDAEVLLHGETFNLVEEVYVVGNPLADAPRPLRPARPAVAHSTPKAPSPAPKAPPPAAAPAPARDDCPRHVVVVAIDFGTTYSGYAFCFTRDPELNIHMMRKWEGGDPGLNNQKTPTTLLLTPDEQFHSFGFAARDFFHDLDIQEAKKWLFFDKFKMALHHDQDMHRDTRVTAANGRSLPALVVFAHALRHLKAQALRELSDQAGADLRPDHIRWVVTVPAIWRQPAKQFIREAAYQAGICSPESPNGLLIALEPEAASICCRKLRLSQLVPEPRPPLRHPRAHDATALVLQGSPAGMRYMVVDCGGGTVDITVHELSERCGTLRELHKATGGPWGSMGVDAEFERLLCAIFGDDFIAQFKMKRPASFTELMVSWEARKRSASPHRDSPLSVFPPFAFIDFFRKTKGKEIEQALRKFGRKDITWSSQGALRMQPNVMRELFRPTIDKILRYIEEVLDSPRVHGIQYLFLVGGFAESQLLQHEVRLAFSDRVRVVIPQGVALTTLRGAVLFGLEPDVVTVRRSKHTYGVGVLKRFQHGIHPPEKLVERDGVEWCADVLDKFVCAEQSVALGEAVVRRYTPALSSQSTILINIYCADSDDAQFTTDPGVRRCGALRLDLTSAHSGEEDDDDDGGGEEGGARGRPREIHTRMVFGGTEITASALDLASRRCVHADVDFLTV